MKGYRRHKFFMAFFRFTLGWLIAWIYGLDLERFSGTDGKPFLLLANHACNEDPIFVGMATRQHLYFVASDHIFRKGWVSALLKWVFAPISRTKGGTDAQTAMMVLRSIRKGASVGIFAEGNRTFNGLTCPIPPATGKLIRTTGVELITYKFSGGYFSTPRWGKSRRRGKITGRVVGRYSPAEIKAMTPDEINSLLAHDLHEDAYATQAENPIVYKGRDLAENIEAALWVCPCCNGIGTLHSRKDQFWCDCGMIGRFTEYCELVSDTLPFKTITEWDLWQQTKVASIAEELSVYPMRDENVTLRVLGEKHRSKVLAHGDLVLDGKTLRCGDVALPVADITDMAIIARATLMLTAAGVHYELKPDGICCAPKYLSLYQELRHHNGEAAAG